MWVGVGILLGLVVVASVLGFHVGPHGHLAAFGLGVVAAAWLVVMAATGRAEQLLWVLLGADVATSVGLAAIAWRGLKLQDSELTGPATRGLVGSEGVTVTELAPAGVVRVRGESWSATSMHGNVPAGRRIQVIEASGVRLGVWPEEDDEDTDPPAQHHLLSGPRHHSNGGTEST
ncbi:MAG: NfeD family protein [Acidimicrobiales bacterium]